jgi:catechol 2,3-dioxygenase-like lactoylglutathione lyase family enzyme
MAAATAARVTLRIGRTPFLDLTSEERRVPRFDTGVYSDPVFDHVTIRVSNRAASQRFYETVLPTLGVGDPRTAGAYVVWGDFSLAEASAERPVTRKLHIAFFAPSREIADEFWRVGTQAGHRDDGAPGPRPQYSEDYYGAFLLDPDGNSVEALHHGAVRRAGAIDHMWIRVADLEASKRFYETIAPYAGFRLGNERPDRVHFAGDGGSFSVVSGEPTENLHIAFPTEDNGTVDAFHGAATAAGYRDDGPPGERAIYHQGYYGAFVLDPDGNSVEVVNHNRR